MTKHIRAFIATRVPTTSLLNRFQRELACLAIPLRVARPNSLHLTFRYLGEIGEQDLVAIADVMRRVARSHQPLEAEIRGTGVFPTREQPRVVWAGVVPREPITQLADHLNTELELLRFPRETHEFKPHLTLGRLKSSLPQPELLNLLDRYSETLFGDCPIEEWELIQSELEPDGPTYTTIASVPLGTVTSGSGTFPSVDLGQ